MTSTSATSVSEIIARALIPHTARVFGVMGNGNAWLVDALERLGHGIIPVRHEVAAVAAADAHHRVTGRPAVATTTYGPGFTNTLTALADAAQARTPLVLVTGDAPTTGPRPWDIDQTRAAAALGVETFTIGVADAGDTTIRALSHALEHHTPVVLALPYDLAALPVSTSGARIPRLPEPPAPVRLAEAVAEAILTRLATARHPLILAGRGARAAAPGLRRLATALGCDVATSAPARGTFTPPPGEMPGYRDLGVCGGFAAEEAGRLIRGADVVLVIGAGLNQFTLAHGHAFSPKAHVVQIDREPRRTSERVDEFHSVDAAAAVQALEEILAQRPASTAGEWGRAPAGQATAEPTTAESTARPVGEEFAEDGRLDPRSVITRLNRTLPPDRLVATDGGHFLGWPSTYLDLAGPDHLVLLGTAFQSIGLGFGAGVGVAAAAGERVTVLATGDGGGLMGLADAESFLRVATRGVVIVFNDAAYGAELHQYATRGLSEEPMRVPEVDFAGLFRALGGRAETVRRLADLADFEEWIESGATGSYLLDCRVSPTIVAPFMREMTGR